MVKYSWAHWKVISFTISMSSLLLDPGFSESTSRKANKYFFQMTVYLRFNVFEADNLTIFQAMLCFEWNL
jgi:hypothetical protein